MARQEPLVLDKNAVEVVWRPSLAGGSEIVDLLDGTRYRFARRRELPDAIITIVQRESEREQTARLRKLTRSEMRDLDRGKQL